MLMLASCAPPAAVMPGAGSGDAGSSGAQPGIAQTAPTMESTLARLRRLRPDVRTKAEAEGLPDVTVRLSPAEAGSVAAHLKACLARMPEDLGQTLVRIVASFDSQGRIWRVEPRHSADVADFGGPDTPRKAWIGRALGSATDPACNPLPLPVSVLGMPGRINLRYSP